MSEVTKRTRDNSNAIRNAIKTGLRAVLNEKFNAFKKNEASLDELISAATQYDEAVHNGSLDSAGISSLLESVNQ